MMRALVFSCVRGTVSRRHFGGCATQICLQWGDSGSQGGGYQRRGDGGGDRGYQGRDGGDRGYQGRDGGGERGYQGRDSGDRGFRGRDGGGGRDYQGRGGGDRGYQGRDGGGDRGYRGRDGGGGRDYQGRGGGDRDYQGRGGGDRDYQGRGGGDRGYQGRDGGDRGSQGRDGGVDRSYQRRNGSFDRGYQGRGAGGSERRDFDGGNRRGGDDFRRNDAAGYGGDSRRSDPPASSNRGIRNAQDRVAESFGAPIGAEHSEPAARISVATGSEELLKLKLKFRSARLKKEKGAIAREAFDCMKRVFVDKSSQDEKSIAVLLNCAVFFGASTKGFLVRDCIEWSLANLGALSAQNLAKFAHAVATLNVRQCHDMLLKISEAVPASGLDAFAPVELIMLQQAFTRGAVLSNAGLQVSILQKLLASIGKMKPSELSTLMDLVSAKSPVLAKEQALVRDIAEACSAQLTPDVINTIHSNNILHFLRAFADLHAASNAHLSEETWALLFKRAIEVSKFFMDSQVGTALQFIAAISASTAPVAKNDVQALDEAVVQRAKHIAVAFDMASVPSLANGFSEVKRDLPKDIVDVLLNRLVQEMAWQRPKLSDVASAAAALLKANVTSPEFFIAAVNFSVGKRPMRVKQVAAGGGESSPVEEARQHDETTAEFALNQERCVEIGARHFASIVKLRLAAEKALGGPEKSEHLSTTVPRMLVDAVPLCHPLQLLDGCANILLEPPFEGRNVKLDNELLKTVIGRVEEGQMLQDETYSEGVEAFLQRMLSSESALHPLVVAVRKSRQQ